jgi:orotidine-5'-phosphate decarboxylase
MNSPAPTISTRDRVIVALDFPNQSQALALVSSLSGVASIYKIGLQLYTAAGPEIVHAVAKTGAGIFLDLKLHDIPNTVGKAVAAAGELGVQMLTVHLSGGRAMLEAAVAAKPRNLLGGTRPPGALLLLGVTVLTSSTAETLHETGVDSGVDEQVMRLGELGKNSKIDGLITSPHEVAKLRQKLGDDITLVTPGVRPAWAEANDQKRFTTPKEALKNGADYLVVGRPITAAKNPREAMERLLSEITQ